MRKPWVYKRKNIKGWWVGWYEGSMRKAKAFPTKALAKHFHYIKYAQLNSDVFTSIVDFDWNQMVGEYQRCKQVKGLAEASLYEVSLTLRHFKQVVGVNSSKGITQQSLDAFVLTRSEEVKKSALNKDIRNMHAFLNWAAKNHFVISGLEIKKVKVSQDPLASLSPSQVRELLIATEPYPSMHLRVSLAVTTGLRRGDIEAIHIGDIHFDRSSITTRNRKAGKALPERPVPKGITAEVSSYVATLPDGQERLFADPFTSKKWSRVRERAKMPDLKFHDLRRTFASLLAPKGVSAAVTRRLLEHSTPQLTNQVYTNVDPVLRRAIDRLPVADWL